MPGLPMARSLPSWLQRGLEKELGGLTRPRSQSGLNQEVPGKTETSQVNLDLLDPDFLLGAIWGQNKFFFGNNGNNKQFWLAA